MARRPSYYTTVTQAIADIAKNGFDSAERIAFWQVRIKEAAEASLLPLAQMELNLRGAMTNVYRRLVDGGKLASQHPGVGRFTVDRLRPQLQAQLQKRIMMSADLIRLNRQQSISKTLQRFSGWASSVPAGGSKTVDKKDTTKAVRKALTSLPFEERRVLIDQGHKLASSLNAVIANDGGAIAVRWHSQWQRPGYNYRVEHKDRDEKIYLLKESWARSAGLVKPGEAGVYEDITAFGEEPFCSCYGEYIYHIRDLPEDMRTAKGNAELKRVRELIANA